MAEDQDGKIADDFFETELGLYDFVRDKEVVYSSVNRLAILRELFTYHNRDQLKAPTIDEILLQAYDIEHYIIKGKLRK